MRFALLASLALSTAAAAQDGPVCYPAAEMAEGLAKQYGETRVAVGLSDRGFLVELWTNDAAGT